jgi:hypothetical protein
MERKLHQVFAGDRGATTHHSPETSTDLCSCRLGAGRSRSNEYSPKFNQREEKVATARERRVGTLLLVLRLQVTLVEMLHTCGFVLRTS